MEGHELRSLFYRKVLFERQQELNQRKEKEIILPHLNWMPYVQDKISLVKCDSTRLRRIKIEIFDILINIIKIPFIFVFCKLFETILAFLHTFY